MKKNRLLVLAALVALVFINLPAWAGDGEEEMPGIKAPVQKVETAKDTPKKKKIGFGLRLNGGMSFLDGGDLAGTKGIIDFYEYIAEAEGLPFVTDSDGDFTRCLEGGVDLLVYLGQRFGVSLGASYLSGSQKHRLNIASPDGLVTFGFDPEIEAIPVNVGLFYMLPLGNRFNLVVEAGGGYAFSRLLFNEQIQHDDIIQTLRSEGKAGGISGFVRLALEAKISRGLFFFVEALGRYAKISGFEGSIDLLMNGAIVESADGSFYSYDVSFPDWTIRVVDFETEPPSGSGYSNVRETEIDFSGVSARAGIRIRF